MKKLLGLSTALLLCAVLAASVAPAGKSKQSVVNLNFATYVWQPTTVKAMGAIVDSWNKSHAGIQVHIVPVDVNSVHDKLLTKLHPADLADIVEDLAHRGAQAGQLGPGRVDVVRDQLHALALQTAIPK